jgi:putative acetyltransferase
MSLIDTPALARRLYADDEPKQMGRRRPSRLSPNALQVLVAIAEGQTQTTRQVADRLALDPSSVSHAITQLKDAGLLAEQASPADGRRRHRSVTDEGHQTVAALVTRAQEILDARRPG